MLQFGDAKTRDVYVVGSARNVPDHVATKAARQLDILAAASNLEEARFAGRGRIAKLPRSRPPRYYLHVVGKWWIGFEWRQGDAIDVKLEQR